MRRASGPPPSLSSAAISLTAVQWSAEGCFFCLVGCYPWGFIFGKIISIARPLSVRVGNQSGHFWLLLFFVTHTNGVKKHAKCRVKYMGLNARQAYTLQYKGRLLFLSRPPPHYSTTHKHFKFRIGCLYISVNIYLSYAPEGRARSRFFPNSPTV